MFLQGGETAFHLAAYKGHADVVNHLFNRKPAIVMLTNKVSKTFIPM